MRNDSWPPVGVSYKLQSRSVQRFVKANGTVVEDIATWSVLGENFLTVDEARSMREVVSKFLRIEIDNIRILKIQCEIEP